MCTRRSVVRLVLTPQTPKIPSVHHTRGKNKATGRFHVSACGKQLALELEPLELKAEFTGMFTGDVGESHQ